MSISIEQVTKLYQGVPVVNDVTIEIQSGEFFVLLGPSGSGKSTLLRALAGLTNIDRGRLSLHGRDVTELRRTIIQLARENGLRVASSAFKTYAMEHNGYPPDVNRGVLPPEMDTYFGPTLDWTAATPIGGQWDWDYRVFAFKAGVSVVDPDASFTEMSAIDKMFDDGSLSSGQFQSIGATRYTDIIEN